MLTKRFPLLLPMPMTSGMQAAGTDGLASASWHLSRTCNDTALPLYSRVPKAYICAGGRLIGNDRLPAQN